MLVSLKWLKDYIDLDLTPEKLADRFTMLGLEVESVDAVEPGFSGVIVSKILSIEAHPNADKLLLCDITTGDETLSVICGAQNIKVGDIVPFAKDGAKVADRSIKRSKVRGLYSDGMLCSEEELGLGSDASGIMILPDNFRLGEDLSSALNIDDIVMEISVTPNRADCLSIIGIAREIAAITGEKLRYPATKLSETGEDINVLTSVGIVNPELCPRYTARIIQNVTIKSSPLWLRMRLEAVGLRSINNVVDVTNFVMMEYGQPLHAFDYHLLEEGKIVVRGSTEGEEFITLDGKTRLLDSGTLMICDGVRPVAIGGVMGGLNTEVNENTDTVFLESAYFNPSSIRRTSRRLGLSSDSSYRFERGVDPEGIIKALDRAAELIAELSDGSISKNYIDRYPQKIEKVKDIPLRMERVREILGAAINDEQVEEILENLDMTVIKEKDGRYLITPPTFRVDILREIDIIEEIFRLYGYDKIPITMPPMSVSSEIKGKKQLLIEQIKGILNGYGYSEVINYSLTTTRSADILGFKEYDEQRRFVKVRSPLSEDMSVMRTTLIFGLLNTMRKNTNVGNVNLKLFEIGKVFTATTESELPVEKEKIGGLLTGARYDELWHYRDGASDFYDLKGCLESILSVLKIPNISFNNNDREIPFCHPGKSSVIMARESKLGYIGEVHPDVLEKMDLKNNAFIFELDFSLLSELFSQDIIYSEIPRFPCSSRDVAFVIDEMMESNKLIRLVSAEKNQLLADVCIFDVYSGKGIPDGMKSLALRFTYRSVERTLTDEEVNTIHDNIVKKIVEDTGAEIRGKVV